MPIVGTTTSEEVTLSSVKTAEKVDIAEISRCSKKALLIYGYTKNIAMLANRTKLVYNGKWSIESPLFWLCFIAY